MNTEPNSWMTAYLPLFLTVQRNKIKDKETENREAQIIKT